MEQRGYNRPQNRRNLRRGIAIALIFAAIMILISDRQQKTMLASGRLSADDLSAKIMGIIATPKRGVEAIFANAGDRNNAYKDNISLKAEIERLKPYENRVLELEMRLRRFEEILAIDNSSDISIQKIVVRTVNESAGPFVHSALLNAGRNKGIQPGYAVMTIDGYYGHVVRVGNNSARVLLVSDLNSRISVMSQRSQSRAILIGDNTNKPRLDFISPDSDWLAGDRVITSGDGGVLPKGLAVGRVETANGQDLKVDLFTNNQPIDWVWVYPYSPTLPPETSPEIETQAPSEVSQ